MEARVAYQTDSTNLLQTCDKPCTMEAGQAVALLDLVQMERMLIPLLNQVRKAQGKRPVIVPKG